MSDARRGKSSRIGAHPVAVARLHSIYDPMSHENRCAPIRKPAESDRPRLDELTRVRLGRQLQALYEPVIDEALDPRLAELLRQLDVDKGARQ